MNEYEVYFGFYLGDCQMWNTDFVTAATEDEALRLFDAQPHGDIAFRGIYCVQEVEDPDGMAADPRDDSGRKAPP